MVWNYFPSIPSNDLLGLNEQALYKDWLGGMDAYVDIGEALEAWAQMSRFSRSELFYNRPQMLPTHQC